MACPQKYIRNPETGRCVMIKGKQGKEVLKKLFNQTELTTFFQDFIVKESYKNWEGYKMNELSALLYLLDKHENDCIILPPNIEFKNLKFKDFEIVWDAEKKTMSKPRNFEVYLSKCLDNEKVRFVGIPVGLEKKDKEGHSNFLIMDKKLKTVEQFEPHGYYYDTFNIKELENNLKYFFRKFGYTFIPVNRVCPFIGPQTIENRAPKLKEIDTSGYCIVWSILYADLRLSYPDIPPLVLQEKLLNTVSSNPEILLITIRNYSYFIQQIGKKFLNLSAKEQATYLKKRLFMSTKPKKCPNGKEISPKSGNCVVKCKPTQYRSGMTGRCRKIAPKNCPKGKEISPKSGNCVIKCKPMQYRSEITGRCRKI